MHSGRAPGGTEVFPRAGCSERRRAAAKTLSCAHESLPPLRLARRRSAPCRRRRSRAGPLSPGVAPGDVALGPVLRTDPGLHGRRGVRSERSLHSGDAVHRGARVRRNDAARRGALHARPRRRAVRRGQHLQRRRLSRASGVHDPEHRRRRLRMLVGFERWDRGARARARRPLRAHAPRQGLAPMIARSSSSVSARR